jgi:outer membrane biosynthesis protein TonB
MFKRILFTFAFCLFIFLNGVEAQTENDKPLKIMSKPHPSYTFAAREYNISGWVQVKVTFQANGKIGEVIYFDESSQEKNLTRYGLVKETIRAAKKIKFNPATKDGQPITVTKVVQYSFRVF